jgi:glycosyltransferase involved in cell wall biosynthesis
VDYRDSWNTTKIFQKKTFIFKALSERLEKIILKAADHVVYCSPPILNKINNKFFDITYKSLLVMNGFDPAIKLSAQHSIPENDCLTIGHFGSIIDNVQNFRDPSLFFDALLKLNKKIKLQFYGTVYINPVWRARLKGMIEIMGNLPHEKALQAMQKMDLLMLLHSEIEGADEVLTSKLFEYIYAQRPILVLGPENMEAARIVTNRGFGYSINLYNRQDIVNKMNKIYAQWQSASLPRYSSENLKEFSRPYQYSKMLNILE